MVFKNASIILKDRVEKADFSFENGVITAIGKAKSEGEDLSGLYLAPGVVDLHVHGSAGFDFMDGTSSDIVKAARGLTRTGTTSCLATSLTSSDEELYKFLEDTEEVMRNLPDDCASIEGVHLEGPYFNPVKAGAQTPDFLLEPKVTHYGKILDKYGQIIKRWSVAPELRGALDFIDVLVSSGIVASGAHTAATYDEVSRAYDHGLSMLTHFFNAMSGTIKDGHRGAVDAGLEIRDLIIELICDGIHVPEKVLAGFLSSKDHSFITACTDSMRGAGLPDGPSVLGSLKHGTPVVIEDGVAKLMDRSHFAGSVATGMRLVDTLYKKQGFSLENVFKITSLNPSKVIGKEDLIGSLEVGKRADFIIFDENLDLKSVFVRGKKV